MKKNTLIIAGLFLLCISCGPDASSQAETEMNRQTLDGVRDFSAMNISYEVVSLKKSPRRDGIDAQFSAINAYTKTMEQVSGFSNQKEVSYKYIDAILGKDLDKAKLAAEGYYLSGLSNGELGLVKTTTDFIIPMASSIQENELMVVLEDDVVLPFDLDMSLRFALQAAPNDWDMLYLGCFQNVHVNNKGGQRSPFYPTALSKNKGYDYNLCPSESLEPIPGTPWKKMTGRCVAGTWAYALRSSSAKKLLNLFKGFYPINGRLPIDEMYRILVERNQINAYCLSPELVRPNYSAPSTIQPN